MLTVLNALPEGFLTTPARELHQILPGPTLIRLPGRRAPALFVSVLLHGNEDSGWTGLQQVLRDHAGRPLPRALTVLVGNVQAARDGLRRLDGQPDFNRVWPGTVEHAGTAEAAAMEQAHRLVMADGLLAAIDLHNNTGLNPHYGVVCRLDPASLHLARLFSRTVVWFRGLAGTQTACFAPHVPSVALECGKPGHPANAEASARFITAVLELAEFPIHAVREQDIDLYHSVATVRVRPETSFTFGEDHAEVCFDPRLDHMNFREMDTDVVWGRTRHTMPLDVRDEADTDVAHRYFSTEGGVLRLQRAAMPAMLTLDERVVRQDCLCYLMERVAFDRVAHAGPIR